MEKIAIVGMGNMGSAIQDLLQQDYEIIGIGRDDSLAQVQTADAIILAVKPQVFLPDEKGHGLADELWHHIDKQQVISIIAGVRIATLRRLLGTEHVVRTMPNIANNLIAWYTEDKDTDHQALQGLMAHWCTNIRLEREEQFDAFTAIAGSGPAYFFRLSRAMERKARKCGFSVEQARLMVVQTFLGAASMVDLDADFEEKTNRVASKGGTTEAGLQTMDHQGFDDTVDEAIEAAIRRSKELGAIRFDLL